MPGDYSQLKAIQQDLQSASDQAGQMLGDAIAGAQQAGAVAAAMATPGPGLAQFLDGEQGQDPRLRVQTVVNEAVHGFVDAALAKVMHR